MKTKKPITVVKQVTVVVPHSWRLRDWPADVAPGNYIRGRRICRAYRSELVTEGALSRLGRELVVLGAGYSRWLAKQADKVSDFDVPANRPEHAAKRNNGAAHQQREAS
jgi:hypothetical protein